MTDEIRVGRRLVRVTHPDKVLFPRARVTKLDLARHYERVAPVMLPYVSGRPLALQAFPGGIEEKGFFMKAVPPYFPDWIARATVPKRGGTVTHALAEDAATLVYLAGQNVVTPHIWLSRADEPRLPDRLILDFDPSGGTLDQRRTFAHVNVPGAAPDGLTVDSDGDVWVALWNGGAVARFAPDGALRETVPVPVDRPTSCAFGGRDGATLFVTTSRDGLEPAALAHQPLAGHVLCIDGLGITGPPCTPYRGP